MESNEQTELTSKTETDSQIESRLTALGGWLGAGGNQAKRKKESETWVTGWQLQGLYKDDKW